MPAEADDPSLQAARQRHTTWQRARREEIRADPSAARRYRDADNARCRAAYARRRAELEADPEALDAFRAHRNAYGFIQRAEFGRPGRRYHRIEEQIAAAARRLLTDRDRRCAAIQMRAHQVMPDGDIDALRERIRADPNSRLIGVPDGR